MSFSGGFSIAGDDRELRALLVAQLDDRAVLSIDALRQGRRAYLRGPAELLEALVVEEQPTEFRGFGTPSALADLVLGVDGWGCLEVDAVLAEPIAVALAAANVPTRFYGSLHYELTRPVREHHHPDVRLLQIGDLDLLVSADPSICPDEPERTLTDGVVAAAVTDGQIVARASCVARSTRYADIGVATSERFQGQGLGTSVASAVARELQDQHLVPVWSTGESNRASQRIAEKLEFSLTHRRTYVVRVPG